MRASATDPPWTSPDGAAAILGISRAALMLLHRDKLLAPDCATCGRNRYLISECERRRDELRAYLMQRYGGVDMLLSDLIVS